MALKIGVADTTFSRVDLGAIAVASIRASGEDVEIVRATVPGVKDLPVACKKLIEEAGCGAAIALGMPGAKPMDKMCSHEASMGLIQAQLLTNAHIVEVFVHEDEARSESDLVEICRERAGKHAKNALALLLHPHSLAKGAGMGRRQGRPDAGPALSGSGFSH
ncbi:MAG: riboflavin synthase [Candidatus Micrarchaeia archaeon]|jgi:riboflavin synthase